MKVLSKKALLEALKLRAEEVELSKGSGVVVRELDAVDFNALWSNPDYAGEVEGTVNLGKLAPALLVECVTDAKGQKIFSESDAEDLEKSGSNAYYKILGAAYRLNGVVPEKN